MNELMAYIDMIKKVLNREYGKVVVCYENGEWYSREHGRNISFEELEEFLLKMTKKE